ncbi:MAG TPA: S8 family peptidase [Blastocatellia bacterium]
MSRAIFGFVFVALVSVCLWPGMRARAHTAQSPRVNGRQLYADGQVLVKFRAGSGVVAEGQQLARELLPTQNGRNARIEPLGADSVGNFGLIHLPEGISVESAISVLENDPRVEYAEPDYMLYPADTFPNDPDFLNPPLGPMWGMLDAGTAADQDLAGIEGPRAWDIEHGQGDVVVAVPDEGIDISHQDLQANIWVNPNPGRIAKYPDDVNGWNFFNNNNQVFDPNTDGQHGTHVAGTIGAVGNNGIGVTGVAWNVQIMPLKFIGTNSSGVTSGSTHDAILAIDYAIKQRKLGINVRVINASWDGAGNGKANTPPQSLLDAIQAAGNAGILFVCAAGNNDFGAGFDMDVESQADFPGAWGNVSNVISVVALTRTVTLADYSNFGHATTSIAAPGGADASLTDGIVSTLPGNQYGPMAGTSMASPHVAGIAVLLADNDPSLTAAQIKQRILNTSQPVLSLAAMNSTSGKADAYFALTNQVAPAGGPQIAAVSTTPKVVTVDGLGFVNGQSTIAVNGVALPTPKYNSAYLIPNGTLTQLTVKLGKAATASIFPSGTTVSVTVVNPGGQTSSPFQFTNQ